MFSVSNDQALTYPPSIRYLPDEHTTIVPAREAGLARPVGGQPGPHDFYVAMANQFRRHDAAPGTNTQEFIFPSAMIPRLAELTAYAAESFVARRPLLEAVLDLTRRMFSDFKFDPKATTVATPLEQVIKHRRGVCQDFAHLQIGCFRALGLPARYVSGYLETLPPPGRPRLVGADASHAWVQIFIPGAGWVDVDPTNNLLPSVRHVTVAWGRDFSDVSPIRGVIVGGGRHTLTVSVDVKPLGEGTGGPARVSGAAGQVMMQSQLNQRQEQL